jgi:hypothetical protein
MFGFDNEEFSYLKFVNFLEFAVVAAAFPQVQSMKSVSKNRRAK